VQVPRGDPASAAGIHAGALAREHMSAGAIRRHLRGA
jgi:hypothetical protein